MRSLQIICLSVLAAFTFPWEPIYAQSEAEFEQRIEDMGRELSQAAREGFDTRAERRALRETFRKAWKLYEEIANNPALPDEAEDRLFKKIEKQIQDEATMLMNEFYDPITLAQWNDHQHQKDFPSKVMSWVASRMLGVAKGFGRTFASLTFFLDEKGKAKIPDGIPYFGRYSQLDGTLKKIMRDARLTIREIRSGKKLNETERTQAAEAMESAIDAFSKSEPVQMARIINAVNLGITGLATWLVLNPPELTGRTSGGPIVWGLIYGVIGITLVSQNSKIMGVRPLARLQDIRWVAGLPRIRVGWGITTWPRRGYNYVSDSIRIACGKTARQVGLLKSH